MEEMMPRYRIEQYELHGQVYEVDAIDAYEAKKKLFNGEGEAVDNSLDFIEVATEYGLTVEDACAYDNDLISEFEKHLIDHNEVLHGIRLIEKLDEFETEISHGL